MVRKSSFQADLKKEQELSKLLDDYYDSHLKNYTFERISNKKEQFQGVDLKFIHKNTSKKYLIDEKAQLDYLNEDLPTFAFEISYQKNSVSKPGWLYDDTKRTDFYSLITGIYTDPADGFLFCKITLVNRSKLIEHLQEKQVTKQGLLDSFFASNSQNGKIVLNELNPSTEGYLFHSKSNKAEKPLNLVLKLDWLIQIGVGKRLV